MDAVQPELRVGRIPLDPAFVPATDVGIHTRLSKDDGTDSSTARQERNGRAYGRGEGWTVADVFSDRDLSALNGASAGARGVRRRAGWGAGDSCARSLTERVVQSVHLPGAQERAQVRSGRFPTEMQMLLIFSLA